MSTPLADDCDRSMDMSLTKTLARRVVLRFRSSLALLVITAGFLSTRCIRKGNANSVNETSFSHSLCLWLIKTNLRLCIPLNTNYKKR